MLPLADYNGVLFTRCERSYRPSTTSRFLCPDALCNRPIMMTTSALFRRKAQRYAGRFRPAVGHGWYQGHPQDLQRTVVTTDVTPRVVGLDDWAIRKGHRYGSMIVDHETVRVIELVKAHASEDIQPWFTAHPQIEMVTRDRSRDYRRGLDAAALQAIQIADRFHLLKNLKYASYPNVKASIITGLRHPPGHSARPTTPPAFGRRPPTWRKSR